MSAVGIKQISPARNPYMRAIKELRKWQSEAVQTGRDARYYLCQAPGGSGKSLVQVMLAQADIRETGNKQLILVPQSHIHHTFFDVDAIRFTLPGDNEKSKWQIGHNLCSCSENAKVRRLKK